MNESTTSPQLLEFLHRHCPTMDHVDVLLTLMRQQGEGTSAEAIAELTRLPAPSVERAITELVHTSAVREMNDEYFLDADAVQPAILQELALMYNTRPVALVRAIYSRHSPIQSFADAFRLRKDENK